MKLYIMRHGQAEMYARSDSERSLSEYGQAEVRRSAESLKDIPIDGILCSPYLRARQTAEIVAEVMNGPTPKVVADITPDDSPTAVLDVLPTEGCWLMVSHMPLVSRLTGLLVDGQESAGPGFYTAMIVELEMDYPALAMAHLKNTFVADTSA